MTPGLPPFFLLQKSPAELGSPVREKNRLFLLCREHRHVDTVLTDIGDGVGVAGIGVTDKPACRIVGENVPQTLEILARTGNDETLAGVFQKAPHTWSLSPLLSLQAVLRCSTAQSAVIMMGWDLYAVLLSVVKTPVTASVRSRLIRLMGVVNKKTASCNSQMPVSALLKISMTVDPQLWIRFL